MLSEALILSFRSLYNHRARSILTALGVLLGILLVVVTGGVGASFQQQMINQTSIGGARAIQFAVGNKANLSFHYLPVFTENEKTLIGSTPHVIRVAPVNLYFSATQQATISSPDGTSHVLLDALTATTPDFFTINDLAFAAGSAFRDDQPQIVLGAGAAQQYGLKVGEQVTLSLPQVNQLPPTWTISGILAPLPATLFGDSSYLNGLIALPLAPVGSASHFEAIDAQVDSTDNLVAAEQSIEQRLNASPELQQALSGSGYQVIGLSRIDNVKSVSQILGQVQLFVIIIAVLAAIIGGIGIANTMLVTVAERMRQIAIMRAVGATRGQVRLLFLTESVLVAAVGIVIGILLGLALALLISLAAGFPVVFAGWTIGVGVILGVFVGIGAGFYPAHRAAAINIREVLTYE
jgi:putative ABC transport system permease protein